jgi:hypothetical protein
MALSALDPVRGHRKPFYEARGRPSQLIMLLMLWESTTGAEGVGSFSVALPLGGAQGPEDQELQPAQAVIRLMYNDCESRRAHSNR